jgi:tripartite-type tricarboxylate transporter receptor subunit TctC
MQEWDADDSSGLKPILIMSTRTRSLFPTLAMALAVITSAPLPAQAQSFPSRTVTIVVPFPPGGGADTLARMLAPRLQAAWGQTVLIENRSGASGRIGTDQVAGAIPDGHFVVMASTGAISDRNLGRLAPLALASAEAYTLVVHPQVAAKNVRELIDLAKANPGQLRFGSSGPGAASHLSGELFKALAGIDMLHVPYKGTGQAVTDLLGGQIEVMFAPTQVVLQHVQAGKLRALAVTGEAPLHALPGVPTVAASGLPNYRALGWFGLLAPAATPAATVARWNVEVNRILEQPEVRKDMLARGADPGTGSPAEFGAFVRAEQAKWAKVMKDAGVTLE